MGWGVYDGQWIKVLSMVKEYTSMLMEVNTMETGLIITEKVGKQSFINRDICDGDWIKISSKGLVFIHMRMEINMMVSGSRI